MAWTLQQYQDRVLSLAADQEPTTADITAWVNEQLQKMQEYAQIPGTAEFTLVDGTANYALPADYYKSVEAYRWDDITEEYPTSVDIVNSRFDKGVRIYNGYIYVQPTPDTEDDGYKLYLDYHKKVTALVNPSDTPNIVEEYQDIPFLHACVRAKQQDAEFGEGRDFMGELTSRMGEFIRSRNKSEGSSFQSDINW